MAFSRLSNSAIVASVCNAKTITLVYIGLIFLYNLCYGNLANISLVDISKIYQVPVGRMTELATYSNVGYLLGTLCGWLYSVGLPRQLLMAAFTLSTAIFNTLVPYYRPFPVALAASSLTGLGLGVYMSGYQAWLIELTAAMHPGADATVMLASQACYGLGMALSPVLASGFLFGEANVTGDGRPLTLERRLQSVAVPFLVTGVAQAIVPVITIVLFFTHRYRPPVAVEEKEQKKKSEGSKVVADGPLANRKFSSSLADLESKGISPELNSPPAVIKPVPQRLAKLALSGAMLALYSATELGYIPFVATLWQEMPIHFSVTEAAHLSSVHSAAYTIAPLVSTLLSLRLQPDSLIWGHFGLLLSGVSLLYLGRLSRPLIYAGNGLLGYGMGAMSPACYAFVNRHLGVTSSVASFLSFSTAACSLAVPLILTQVIDSQPLILIYLLIIFLLASLACFVLLKLWIFISNNSSSSSQNVDLPSSVVNSGNKEEKCAE